MNKTPERRKHRRFPIIRNLAKPVELILENPVTVTPVPAILFDLSPGGMGLLSFMPVETDTRIIVHIDLEGIKIGPIQGKVLWSLAKDESWRLGIIFTRIEKTDFELINNLSNDYSLCDNKTEQDCSPKCRYFPLCAKKHKKEINGKLN